MITLSSDFGPYYPAIMKGVIRDRSDAELLDITHQFPRHDVRVAAFWLREILSWFPKAVHLVVVDPGVGSERKAIIVRAGGHALVGPDNGVMIPAARRLSSSGGIESFEIPIDDVSSATFHGRDVFAPMAATVHERGIDSIEHIAQVVPDDDIVDLRFPSPVETDTGVRGEVLVVDGFGNVVTNIPGEVIAPMIGEHVTVNSVSVPVVETYGAVASGDKLVTVGSHGNVELAVNRGRGDTAFEVSIGSELALDLD